MVHDVGPPYFEAKLERDIGIELPDEDKAEDKEMVGILQKSVYGRSTNKVRKFMPWLDFIAYKYNYSTYLHSRDH